MLSRFVFLLIAATLPGLAATSETRNSSLFPTVSFAGCLWRLDDFSYVEYRLGAESLGNVLCKKFVRIAGRGDISAEFQSAIDAVGAAGGGIVALPKGLFLMSSAVPIPNDNVSNQDKGSAELISTSRPTTTPTREAKWPKSNCSSAIFTG